MLVFAREYGRAGPPPAAIVPGGPTVFDSRFTVLSAVGRADEAAVSLVPLGRLGLGNATERTLPVAIDVAGRPVAAPACLHRKLGPGLHDLVIRERLSWRLFADLPTDMPGAQGGCGRHAATGG
ncbi:hypothetical protein [Aureimonas sp. SA4125]|uniref:hypothetical protein n=1 Tax=Aureimonas sp. SA4125 TaxID=2826993 RepID=UPI001CC4A8D1|nr:hypothetical protein [Aureimonas sp. SA4125]